MKDFFKKLVRIKKRQIAKKAIGVVAASWAFKFGAIDRSKRGPSNHKAFLTKEGKKIMQDRQKDFELIFLIKKPDSYLFTAESNHYKPLDRVAIT